ASTVEEVMAAAALDRRSAVQALERLAGGGLVEQSSSGGLAARTDRFKDAARRAAAQRPAFDPKDVGATPEQGEVLRNFGAADRRSRIGSGPNRLLPGPAAIHGRGHRLTPLSGG